MTIGSDIDTLFSFCCSGNLALLSPTGALRVLTETGQSLLEGRLLALLKPCCCIRDPEEAERLLIEEPTVFLPPEDELSPLEGLFLTELTFLLLMRLEEEPLDGRTSDIDEQRIFLRPYLGGPEPRYEYGFVT